MEKMTNGQSKDYIKNVRWQFAKSMPSMPHAYTIKSWRHELKETFEAFVAKIREEGYDKTFYGKTYKYLDIDDIVIMDNQPRKHSEASIKHIQKSIEEYGQAAPLCIDKKNRLIAGHAVLDAMKKLGHKTIKVNIMGFDDEDKSRGARAVDNLTSELSEWDETKRRHEVGTLAGELAPFKEICPELNIKVEQFSFKKVTNTDVAKKTHEISSVAQGMRERYEEKMIEIPCPKCGGKIVMQDRT